MTGRGRLITGEGGRRLEAVLDQIPAGTCILHGPDHVFAHANEHYLRMIGGSIDIIGKPVRVALPEVVEQGFVELLDTVYTTGQPVYRNEALMHRLAPGEEARDYYFNFAYLATRNDDGVIDGILAHVVDVTDLVIARHKVEELARDLELQRASLAATVEQLPAGVVMNDTTGRITFANSTWRNFFGVPIGDVNGVSEYAVFDGTRSDGTPYRPEEYPIVRSVQHGEHVVGELMHIRSAAGEMRTIEVNSSPIRDVDDQIVEAVAVFFDVTERVAMERELGARRAAVESQRVLDNVFDAAGDGIWVLDARGRTIALNPAAQQLTGWSHDDLVGKISHDVIHHSHADGSPYSIEHCPIYRSVRFGERCEVADEVFWRKDGTSFPVSYRSTPIYDGDQLVGAVQVFRDLTRERADQLERERVHATKAAQQKAYEINDTIVQRLAVADLAFSMGRTEEAAGAVRNALSMSKRIINDWASESNFEVVRSTPAGPQR